MPLDESQVAARVAEELARIVDQKIATALASMLVRPRACSLEWDYGGEPCYPGFIVAEDPESGTGIAFSESGFGPKSPWGLIFVAVPAFGMDSGWYSTLEAAFRESWAFERLVGDS